MTTETPTEEKTPTDINDIQAKDRLTGIVRRVELFGAFIDVGVGRDGLLHVSQLGKGVSQIQDAMKVGDEVTVWVRKVDAGKGRIELTMTKPLALEWFEIKKGTTVTGTVSRLENFGAFVDIGAERPALLHVREMSSNFVSHPQDVVKIGDEVTARVINVDRRRKKIDLSTKVIDEEEQAAVLADDEDEEEMLSPMALALQAAMSSKGRDSQRRRKKRKKSTSRAHDDVLTRTLQGQDKG